MVTPNNQSINLCKKAELLRCVGGAVRFLCAYCGVIFGVLLFIGARRGTGLQG